MILLLHMDILFGFWFVPLLLKAPFSSRGMRIKSLRIGNNTHLVPRSLSENIRRSEKVEKWANFSGFVAGFLFSDKLLVQECNRTLR